MPLIKKDIQNYKFSKLLETYLNLREELTISYKKHGTEIGEIISSKIKPDLDLIGDEMNRRIDG